MRLPFRAANAVLTGLTFSFSFLSTLLFKLLALPAFGLSSLNSVQCYHCTITAFNKRGIPMNFTQLGLLI